MVFSKKNIRRLLFSSLFLGGFSIRDRDEVRVRDGLGDGFRVRGWF